jgi:hypothetical protein
MWFDYWVYQVPFAVAMVAAAVVLVRRHRSRRATGLAVVALAGLAGDWLLNLFLWLGTDFYWSGAVPDDLRGWLYPGITLARTVCGAGCIFLLVCAVTADRRPTPPAGPEADYRDPPAAPPPLA